MKFNVECEKLEFNPEFTLEENGLLSLFSTYNNKGIFDLKQVCGPNQVKNIARVLKQLSKKDVFNIKETNENDSLVINIINGSSKQFKPITNISKNKKMQICFQLNESKMKSITERSNDSKSFKFNLVNVCFENYTTRKLPISEVNSQAEFVELMYSITPFETINIHDKTLTRKDFDNIFEIINNNDVDLALINFAIDYAISSSKYYNLNYEFVQILLDSWKKNKVSTVDNAIELIALQKASVKAKGSKYVDPTYDAPVESSGEQIDLNNIFLGDGDFE